MTEHRHALLIANKEYAEGSGFAPLSSPHADARALEEVLGDTTRGKFDEVDVLLDRTRNEVLIAITDAIEKKGRTGLLLIYFSGHGDTNAHGDLFLATADSTTSHLEATAVDAHHIARMMGRSDGGKTVLVLDCCHAGAFPTGLKSGDVVDAAAKRYSHAGGSYVLMACGAFEPALDGAGGKLSLLTEHLVRGLQGGADVNGDGVVTANELASYLDQSVSKGGRQKFNQSGRNRHGEVVLSWSGIEPFEDMCKAVRAKLLEWAGAGAVADKILADVLGYIGDLSFEDLDGADQKQLLIRRVADGEVNSGDFNLEWLQAKQLSPKMPEPDIAADPKPKPEPAPPPSVIRADMTAVEPRKKGGEIAADGRILPQMKMAWIREASYVIGISVLSSLVVPFILMLVWQYQFCCGYVGDNVPLAYLGTLVGAVIAGFFFRMLNTTHWPARRKFNYIFWRTAIIYFLTVSIISEIPNAVGAAIAFPL